MELENFVKGIKWEIVSILAKTPMSPSEIAEKLQTSVPNISQQLRIMELSGIVKKERKKVTSLRTTRVEYKLVSDLHFVASCSSGLVYKETFEKSDCLRAIIFALLGVKKKGVFEVLLKFFLDNSEIILEADFVAISHIGANKIDLLVITSKHLEKLRGALANQVIEVCGNKMTLALWSHTSDEFTRGLARKEHYFVDYLKKDMHIVHFKDKFINIFRVGIHE